MRMVLALLLSLLCGPVFAQGGMMPGPGTAHSVASGCTEASNFVARALVADPSYDAGHQAADTTFICGLVNTNSTISGTLFSRFDFLHIEATQSIAVAKLNLISTSFPLVTVSVGIDPTLSIDRGTTSIQVSNSFWSTGFTPSSAGGKCAIFDCHVAVWANQTGSPSFGGDALVGVAVTSNFGIQPQATSTFWINNLTGITDASTNGYGLYITSRNASGAYQNYRGATLSFSTLTAGTGTATSLPTDFVAVGAMQGQNINGKQVSADSVGSQLSATDAQNFYTLLQTRMTAVGN